ncbi:MAG: hypothetical protein NC320_06235 [Clostridium sp.]|nr:hypothetical protein [Clostridium sp.]
MARRIPWSKHEIALPFLTYENVVNGSSMKEQVSWLSDILRRLASINWIVIDGTFRNINGMNMQLGNVQFLFTGGEKGLSGTSRAIRNMYDIYVNDHDQFDAILREATIMMNAEVTVNTQSQNIFADNQDTIHKPIKRILWMSMKLLFFLRYMKKSLAARIISQKR